ncbi:kinase-like domain-containing protein [Dichotomocladium elegans]|nr:kinase-like domain-containing protein [Dichotomocladium elegans]
MSRTASVDSLRSDMNDSVRETLSLENKDGTPSTQYQLGNCIGKGQFGSVYKALDLATGEIVAVKRLQLNEDGGALDEEIMKEVSLLQTLSHTNVISYLGFVRSKNHINIILEFAENGSLMSTLKAFGAFPEKLVASFCVKILNGLEYLHANSVVHCDLKAANILTTKTGDVKLTDFGVSLNMKLKENSDDGVVSGTPNWMAPEVIELKGATPKSDIWSLGCTIHELATGKPPYANLIAMSAMFRIVEDDAPPLPDDISSDMKDFLLSCFQKDPEKRPSAAELKSHPWILKHMSSAATPQKKSREPSIASEEQIPSGVPVTENDRNLQYPRIYYNIMPDERSPQHGEFKIGTATHNLGGADESGWDEAASGASGSHRFTSTHFGKVMVCKVCDEKLASDKAIFCEVCSLVCHDECKQQAFSCPPKVNNQQPSYDWVFSAKIYNHRRRQDSSGSKSLISMEPEFARIQCNSESKDFLKSHPQAASIRKYAQALGLTPHEIKALSENPALLSHTIALNENPLPSPRSDEHPHHSKSMSGRIRSRKNSSVAVGSSDDQCIIS